jgi:transposase
LSYEFYFIEKILNNWNDEIINILDSPYFNASIKRINRTIKQAKNIALCFKNFEISIDLIKMKVTS